MSYTGILPTGLAGAHKRAQGMSGLGATNWANLVPHTPKQVGGIYASNYDDWITPLTKAGLSISECMIAVQGVMQTPANQDTDSAQFFTLAKAVRGALKTRGYQVNPQMGAPFVKGSVEDKVLSRQFTAQWSQNMVWGALVLGALSAPMNTGPGADVGGIIKGNLPLIAGAAVALFFILRK